MCGIREVQPVKQRSGKQAVGSNRPSAPRLRRKACGLRRPWNDGDLLDAFKPTAWRATNPDLADIATSNALEVARNGVYDINEDTHGLELVCLEARAFVLERVMARDVDHWAWL